MPPAETTSPAIARKEARKEPPAHKRTYQACRACRSAKLRCDLGDPDAPDDPPCRRCKRTGRECVFGGVYLRKSSTGREDSVAPSAGGETDVGMAGPDEAINGGFAINMNNMNNQGNQYQRGGTSGFNLQDMLGTSAGSSSRLSDGLTTPFSAFHQRLPSFSSSSAPLSNRVPRSSAQQSHPSFNNQNQHFNTGANAGPSGSSTSKPHEFKFVRGETLENPADALRILAAAVEDERPREKLSQESEPVVEPGRWNRWIPVRDGLLTADEASILLSYYGEKINPMHPVVPIQMFQPAYFASLLREPILLAAMVATAARYYDLGLSFDMSEPMRSRIIQGKIVAWLLQRIGFITMGETSSRTIGTVEALLILSEWPPREQYLFDSAIPEQTRDKDSNPAKVYDDLSWTLIGLAVRIALELDLQNERTYRNDQQAEWITHRRHNTWIYRHASVRLGRASLVQGKMSMSWWEVASMITKKEGDQTFPFERSEMRWRENMGVAQLTHTIGLLQEMLYATPEHTAELIKTGRYESTLHRLKPELDSTWHAQMGDLPPVSVLDADGPTFTDEELTEIRWRIEFDYVRLFGNAIAMRAAQDRMLRRHKHSQSRPERIFDKNVIKLAEGSFVIEAVDAATNMVKCGVAMQKKGVLRYCPCRVFLRLVFASVFLMKAVTFGAVAQSEQEIVELQYQLIDSLREASPDDRHVAHHLSTLLSRVFPAMPAQSTLINLPTILGTTDDNMTGTQVDTSQNNTNLFGLVNNDNNANTNTNLNNNAFNALPWLGLDFLNTGNSNPGGMDNNPLDWDTGIVSGFGYDPSSIVSDIEQMLAATDQGNNPNSIFNLG